MILRRDLQKPLTHIARFVGQLDPQRLSDPITLQRPDHHQNDEIDIVLEGFRTLQSGIDQHIANLDRLVAERTVKLEQAMAEIHVLSITDPLTHCFNRRLFNERIVQEFERAKRYERPLSLIFCDIDHFKNINDTFGHAAGDEILIQVADCYRDGLRADIDWVARYGGEEFVIVLPETELESARATAERRRAAIAARGFTSAGQTLRVTSSFGVSQLQADESVEAFLNRADRAVYQAKAQGRDCVVCDHGTPADA
jgi:diguanylate cyclase (GGDEF)-like protein